MEYNNKEFEDLLNDEDMLNVMDKMLSIFAASGMIEAKILQKHQKNSDFFRDNILNKYVYTINASEKRKQIVSLFLDAYMEDLKKLESKLEEEN